MRFHFRQNKTMYFMFLFCVVLGMVLGFVVIFSSDNYLKLLTSESKKLYPYINGTAETMVLFWKGLMSFSLPLLLIALLGINFYLSLLSYVFITYQSSLFILSCGAVIKTYGFSGFFNVLMLMVPVNLLYFCVLIYFSVVCINRSRLALKNKLFGYGFDESFFFSVAVSIVAVVLICVLIFVVYPMFLKNSVFLIF